MGAVRVQGEAADQGAERGKTVKSAAASHSSERWTWAKLCTDPMTSPIGVQCGVQWEL